VIDLRRLNLDQIMMKHIAKFSFVISFLLICVCDVVSQDANQRSAFQRQSISKTRIKTAYDASKDETQVFIPLTTVNRVEIPSVSQSRTLQMTIFFSFAGQTPVKPKLVTIGFFSSSRGGAEFADKRDLIVTADDVRTNLGKLEPLRENFSVLGPPSGMISPTAGIQVLALSVPAVDFLRIAEAKEVKVQAGDTKFELSNKYMEAIRELANLVRP
jgi:hypothetical protein